MSSKAAEAPSGLFLRQNAVAEETWQELRKWLGLTNAFDENCSKRGGARSPSPLPSPKQQQAEGEGESEGESEGEGAIPWERSASSQHRRVAQFGSCRYDYVRDVVSTSGVDGAASKIPPVPEILRSRLLHPSVLRGVMPEGGGFASGGEAEAFTQCIVNVYEKDIEIPWHVDDMRFGPIVLVFVFGETRPLKMRPLGAKERDTSDVPDGAESNSEIAVLPAHRSCYILSGEARDEWEHSVPPGQGWRVSFTFRTLREQCG